MSKIGMIGIGSNPSEAMFSHAAGWTAVIKSIARQEFGGEVEVVKNGNAIHAYDTLIINEGINYKEGSWNFFGGMQDRSFNILENLQHYKGDVYSYNEEICWSSLFKRKELRDHEHIKRQNMPLVKLHDTRYCSDKIIVGDSHTVSIYEPGYAIDRNDGATLYGALRPGGLLDQYDFTGYSEIILYFGNIDLRFHLNRQPNVLIATDELTNKLTSFATSLVWNGKKVKIQGLLPVECETRKLPGTGLYKGQPFYGSKATRMALRTKFNGIMGRMADQAGFEFRDWDLPREGFQEEHKFFCMEARQSVHLRPEYYLHKNKLFKNGKN